MDRTKIISELKEFKKKIHKKYPHAKMILFGSQAWGTPRRDSDIDLMIISSKFQHTKSFKRGVDLYKYWDIDSPVDFLCYTPQEFQKLRKQITLVQQVDQKGTVI